MGRLQGRRALVTGAGRGIGFAIAEAMTREGAEVAVNDIDAPRAEAAVARLGGNALCVPGDVSTGTGVAAIYERIAAAWGGVDIVVNNAGADKALPILEMDEAEWDRLMAINLKSIFLVTKAALPFMIERHYGRVLSLASIVARQGALNGGIHYATSKAGVLGFTRTLARQMAKHGITANAIAPGVVDTDLVRENMPAEMRVRIEGAIPLGAWPSPATSPRPPSSSSPRKPPTSPAPRSTSMAASGWAEALRAQGHAPACRQRLQPVERPLDQCEDRHAPVDLEAGRADPADIRPLAQHGSSASIAGASTRAATSRALDPPASPTTAARPTKSRVSSRCPTSPAACAPWAGVASIPARGRPARMRNVSSTRWPAGSAPSRFSASSTCAAMSAGTRRRQCVSPRRAINPGPTPARRCATLLVTAAVRRRRPVRRAPRRQALEIERCPLRPGIDHRDPLRRQRLDRPAKPAEPVRVGEQQPARPSSRTAQGQATTPPARPAWVRAPPHRRARGPPPR
ncbi:MAG: SDR family NAD(P)-dependent oxidoreductase [Geminicoccaceae bacterium]